jgi:hypothetical protein
MIANKANMIGTEWDTRGDISGSRLRMARIVADEIVHARFSARVHASPRSLRNLRFIASCRYLAEHDRLLATLRPLSLRERAW